MRPTQAVMLKAYSALNYYGTMSLKYIPVNFEGLPTDMLIVETETPLLYELFQILPRGMVI